MHWRSSIDIGINYLIISPSVQYFLIAKPLTEPKDKSYLSS